MDLYLLILLSLGNEKMKTAGPSQSVTYLALD